MDREGKEWIEMGNIGQREEIMDREGKYRTERGNIGHRGNY